MSSQVNTKIRLVKCPKCRKLLAELPDISVYICGGCDTVLQAKIRNLETINSDLSSQQTCSASTSQHDDASVGDGISSSLDVASQSEDSPLRAEESVGKSEDPQWHQKELHDNKTAEPRFSDKLSSSCEITREEEQESKLKEDDDDLVDEVQNLSVRDQPETDLPERGTDNSSPSEYDENGGLAHANGIEKDDLVDEVRNLSVRDQPESDLPERGTDNSSPSEYDENGGLAHANGVEKDESVRAPGSPSKESLVSFYLTTDDENLVHSLSRVDRNFGRVTSIDSNLNSELTSRHGSMANFPTNGSYYGSESSYDGTDYRTRERVSHPSRKNRGPDYARPKPEMAYWETSPLRHETRSGQWSNSSMETSRYTSRTRTDNRDSVFPESPFTSKMSKPPRQPSYSDPEKVDLLRTVYELKDQLNRMQFHKVSPTQRFPDEKFAAFCREEREKFAELSHLNGYNRVKERRNNSRLAFSGEAARNQRQISCSCAHYSMQLPSCSMHCKNHLQVVHTSHCTRSEPSIYDTKSETQNLDEMKRLHSREKYHVAKRHLRPLAGGAPLIACYHCSDVLQLPVDFLLFKKRCHKLMCNGCKKILKFSLLKGIHIVPYNDDNSAPPPSEADPSHCSSSYHLDPVSYSDDYGREFCRSCSTEEEARVQRNPKMKGVLVDSVRSTSTGSSSITPKFRKFRSEIEEVPSTSPLHRLMGYGSPSQVLHR